MLLLRAKKQDVVRIGDDILIRIDGVSGKNLHLQIDAPREKKIVHDRADRACQDEDEHK